VLKIGAITMDHVQGFDRNQEILFPAKIDDYIEEENLVRFIEAFVALLDLTLLRFVNAEVNYRRLKAGGIPLHRIPIEKT
jgi:transposase